MGMKLREDALLLPTKSGLELRTADQVERLDGFGFYDLAERVLPFLDGRHDPSDIADAVGLRPDDQTWSHLLNFLREHDVVREHDDSAPIGDPQVEAFIAAQHIDARPRYKRLRNTSVAIRLDGRLLIAVANALLALRIGMLAFRGSVPDRDRARIIALSRAVRGETEVVWLDDEPVGDDLAVDFEICPLASGSGSTEESEATITVGLAGRWGIVSPLPAADGGACNACAAAGFRRYVRDATTRADTEPAPAVAGLLAQQVAYILFRQVCGYDPVVRKPVVALLDTDTLELGLLGYRCSHRRRSETP